MRIRSNVQGIAWPALVGEEAARLAATMFELERSQWWDADTIASAQRDQLLQLAGHAREHSPYWRSRLGSGTDPSEILDNWASLKPLTRADIQSAGKSLHSSAPPKAHGPTTAVQTSGSTGQPVKLFHTGVNRFFWQAITLREHLWHRRDFNAKLCSIRPDRECEDGGSEAANWGRPAAMLYQTGPSSLLHSSTPIEQQAEWLIAQQPNYLLSMPGNLRALADHFVAEGLSLPSLRELRSYGESIDAALRERMASVFGVAVVDIYSTVEAGYIALQCPDHEHYHLQSETVLAEVLDEHGRACAPGEIGRLVITPLHHFASPVLRYEIGDYVELGGPCPCGRGLPVITRVLGRERNLLTMPDGSRHWPSFPEEDWMHIAPVQRLQLAQTGAEHIEVRLVMQRELEAREEEAFRQVLTDCLQHRFDFTFSYHENLQRGRNLKFEDFVSEI